MGKKMLFVLFSLISLASKSQEYSGDLYQQGFEKHHKSYYATAPEKLLVVYSYGITDGLPRKIGNTEVQIVDDIALRKLVKKRSRTVLIIAPLNVHQGKMLFTISEFSVERKGKHMNYLKHGQSEFIVDKNGGEFSITEEYHSGI